ncbi:MAG: hypothetical protein Q8K82_17780 [Gemmatimonadaceae bacterium]|nr:hypothetical protein [Gemmatimonadaceae bacterium]
MGSFRWSALDAVQSPRGETHLVVIMPSAETQQLNFVVNWRDEVRRRLAATKSSPPPHRLDAASGDFLTWRGGEHDLHQHPAIDDRHLGYGRGTIKVEELGPSSTFPKASLGVNNRPPAFRSHLYVTPLRPLACRHRAPVLAVRNGGVKADAPTDFIQRLPVPVVVISR